MFWALVLEAGKRYTQKVDQGFHISMAALEMSTDSTEGHKGKGQAVAVMGGRDKDEVLLCNLNSRFIPQQALDLNFSEGEVTFYINGEGTVHLTGYEVMDDEPDFSALKDLEDDDSEEEEDVPQLVPAKKRKQDTEPKVEKKKMKWITPEDDDDDDSEEDSDDEGDEDDDLDVSEFMDMDAEEYDEDDDDDEDEDDLEEESEDEIVPVKKSKSPKAENKTPKQDKTQKQENKTPVKKDKSPNKATPGNKKQQQTPNAPSQSGITTPGGDAESTKSAKKKKKKRNKNKKDGETLNGTPAVSQEQGEKTPKQQKQQKQTPKKQVLGGGTIMEEIHGGEGQVARAGKMAHVYYVGKLQKDGRQFDSCTNGKPFRFRLGKGEVIKGWDAGVEGMKVGGKRRLTVPPQSGYGNQKSGPIPPNSTLVFEVELKNVS